jgi:Protein of unknown function (DUF1295)
MNHFKKYHLETKKDLISDHKETLLAFIHWLQMRRLNTRPLPLQIPRLPAVQENACALCSKFCNLKMIPHGVKGPSPVGTTLFIVLRGLDPIVQYLILVQGLRSLLLSILLLSHPHASPTKALILLAMALGSTLKQIYTLLYTANEIMPASSAAIISASQTFFNSANSIISLTTATSFLTPEFLYTDTRLGISPLLILGSAGYVVGLAGEIISETQRKNFKADPKNHGKLYSCGLFGFARHINYGSNMIWRASYALASGGWVYGLVALLMFAGQFLGVGVPIMDRYCTKKVSLLVLRADLC